MWRIHVRWPPRLITHARTPGALSRLSSAMPAFCDRRPRRRRWMTTTWLRAAAVNLSGSSTWVREAARRMIPRGGGAVVINRASELRAPRSAGLCRLHSDEGRRVLAMTRAFAAELAGARNPGEQHLAGHTRNPYADGPNSPPRPTHARERADNQSTSIPLGRFGQPGDIAAARRVPVVGRGRLHHRHQTWSSTAVGHRVSPPSTLGTARLNVDAGGLGAGDPPASS